MYRCCEGAVGRSWEAKSAGRKEQMEELQKNFADVCSKEKVLGGVLGIERRLSLFRFLYVIVGSSQYHYVHGTRIISMYAK
jgi:hypothetical protein